MSTTQAQERALACPFCGHVGLSFDDGSTYRWGLASCDGCGATAGETRREYPDNGEWHSDAIEQWNRRATPPSAAPAENEDAALLDWLERNLFERKWEGTLGKRCFWYMRGDYRHTMQRFEGETLRNAIRAARKDGK
jgi:transcription elongation factor Elf1